MVPHLWHAELMVVAMTACVDVWMMVQETQRKMEETLQQTILRLSQDIFTCSSYPCELTFASLHALNPPMFKVSVAGSSAVLKPSTPRSATTDFPGFLERAALWARHRFRNR